MKNAQGLLAAILVATILFVTMSFNVNGQSFPEYQHYVHSFLNDDVWGNWTYVDKPVFPVYFNTSQIGIGYNWTIVCPLQVGHKYHVYCYGAWVNTGSQPKTDYDIYVYNPKGTLESMHTEAAGLPEHLGTTVDDPFFEPLDSGNYTFVLTNDARESHGAQQATFMIVEHIECDAWRTHCIEGKSGNVATLNTSWTYEFITDAPRIELWVRVPDTLDMYEARLYLMNKPQSISINNVSLPWEMGLYGNLSGNVGGYNLESEGYRGVAYASCEYNGQDMFLNYTAPAGETNVYHLVLMGEVGSGTVEYLIKTMFGGSLSPLTFPNRVYPTDETLIAYAANSTALENATLLFTTDNWVNTTTLTMTVSNMTCNGTIPRQEAGSFVKYRVQAVDTVKNNLTATGNFTVKHPSLMSFNSTQKTVSLGENITVMGMLEPQNANDSITVQFLGINSTELIKCRTFANGTFTVTFQPETAGIISAQATFAGSATVYGCESDIVMITVEDASFLSKNILFIGGGVGGALAAVGIVVYFKKFRQ